MDSPATGPAGSGETFDQLYERIAPALFIWASLRIRPSIRAQIDPEDVVQEVWWRALDGFAAFDPDKGSFRGWVFGIATRVLLNALRSLRVRGGLAKDGPSGLHRKELPSSLIDQATSVSQRAARADLTRQLLDYVGGLDEGDRAIFAHCALEGLSAPAAAAILGIPAPTAAKRWQRLRERLRRSPLARDFIDRDPEPDG